MTLDDWVKVDKLLNKGLGGQVSIYDGDVRLYKVDGTYHQVDFRTPLVDRAYRKDPVATGKAIVRWAQQHQACEPV